MTVDVEAAFSRSYAEAREKFIEAATAAGLLVESNKHPLPGRDGETLAMDVARDGDPSANRLLILTSACHGVEGYCGSGIQVAALRDETWLKQYRDAGWAVLYVHALNPYGFSHIRRVTHENVDLNRNFHDFDKPLLVNEGYREIHPLLLPEVWPPDAQNQQAVGHYLATKGEKAFQAAVSGGQYEFPDGMFFGGTKATWSNLALRDVLRTYGRRAAQIAWIDLHTGLGPSGHGERIFASRNDAAALERARKWWGGGGNTPVTSIYDGSSTSAFLTGMMFNAVYDECPQAEYTGLALEFGTVPILQTMQAMRAEQWLNLHPDQASPQLAAEIRKGMLEAFYTDTPEWRRRVWEQGRGAMGEVVSRLG